MPTNSGVKVLANGNETTLLAAAAPGLFFDMISLQIANGSPTPTYVEFRDATGGAVVDIWYAPAGATVGIVRNSPLPQTAATNNWTVKLLSAPASADVRVIASFNPRS